MGKILIVNDDQVTQKLIKMRLEYAGYSVVSAHNGKEAMQGLQKDTPDLIISNDVSREGDSFALCKVLKENPDMGSIPIVILSSNRCLKDSFLALGVNEIFDYPVEGDMLLSRIQKIIVEQTLQKQLPIASGDKKGSTTVSVEQVERVLIGEDNNDLIIFMCDALKKEGRYIEVVSGEENIINKALSLSPQIILMNVQMEHCSIKKIITQLNHIPKLKTQVLLYIYFAKRDMADNSETHYFYTHYFNEISGSITFPIYYMGVLDKGTFKNAVEARTKQESKQ